ncbi:MAG: SUMF1/EgtB/PvdO family nonheme iron enzyme [Candidatus Latescibacterota bacterium]
MGTPKGQVEKSSNRVVRGGSWNNDATWMRAGLRNNNTPSNRNNNVGFRAAKTAFPPRGGIGQSSLVLARGKRAKGSPDLFLLSPRLGGRGKYQNRSPAAGRSLRRTSSRVI